MLSAKTGANLQWFAVVCAAGPGSFDRNMGTETFSEEAGKAGKSGMTVSFGVLHVGRFGRAGTNGIGRFSAHETIPGA